MRRTGILAAAALLAAAACTGPAPEEIPDRAAAIPADAEKVLPGDDPNPPVLHSGEWEDPEPVEGPINTAGAEDSPFVTPDGETLYFWFTPDASLPAEEQLGDGVTGIWVSRREAGAWGPPERVVLSDPGRPTLDGCGFVRGDVIWFCSAREGNYRAVDFYTARRVDGEWAGWTNAGELLNAGYRIGELHVSADGTEMYFHSERPGGRGGLDIWRTRLEDGAWLEPENVTEVNTTGDEGWPFLSEDGSELWITRTDGAPSLYRSRWEGGQWTVPRLIVSRFAGEAALDGAGNLYFTHHFYDGGTIEADIYVAHRR